MSEFGETSPVCNTCKACFTSIEKVKEHYKGGWHAFNTKRRANNQPPLKKKEFKTLEQNLVVKIPNTQLAKAMRGSTKSEIQNTEKLINKLAAEKKMESPDLAINLEPEISASISIFDNKKFPNVEECVIYMEKNFGFFIPEKEYLVNKEGFLVYCGEKVKLGGYCLYCQKQFLPGPPCQSHMIDKSHCKVAFEEDVDLDELEDFYDFSSSYQDVDEELDLDEDGNIVESEATVSALGELVLPNGRTVGHRDFRRYYKQRYQSDDQRPEVVAQQREQLMRFGYDAETANQVYSMRGPLANKPSTETKRGIIACHKYMRKSEKRRHFASQRKEQRFGYQQALGKESRNTKIDDYHRILA